MTLFQQVKNAILEKISSKEWSSEQRLPNEIELSRLFEVSQGTIRRAVRELCEERILIKKQGKGTFVCDYVNEFDLLHKKFVHVKYDGSPRQWKTKTKLVSFEIIDPTPKHIALLRLNSPSDKVIHIKLIRKIKTLKNVYKIQVFDEVFLPQKLFQGLTAEMFEQQSEGLYKFYHEYFGISIAHIKDQLKATLLTQEQAQLAELPQQPVIVTQRVGTDLLNRVCELRYITNITDNCHLLIEI